MIVVISVLVAVILWIMIIRVQRKIRRDRDQIFHSLHNIEADLTFIEQQLSKRNKDGN